MEWLKIEKVKYDPLLSTLQAGVKINSFLRLVEKENISTLESTDMFCSGTAPDVKSFLTNIPLSETFQIISQYLFSNPEDLYFDLSFKHFW